MDSKHIESLLEKYWKAETSLEEEKALRDYFHNSIVPEQLNETAQLFRYFENEKSKTLNENFGDVVTKRVQQRHDGKIVQMNWFRFARVAAGIAVMVAAVYLIGREVRSSSPKQIADTESDPQLAFEETKKALMMISKNFNKAQREASKINLINEAEEKIQRKTKENEQDKKVNI